MVLPRLTSLLRNLFRKQREERELDEEVRSYERLLEDENILAGMNPEEAHRQARLELGSVEQVKERVREIRAGHLLETLWQDLRFGVRMLRKNLAFTLLAIFALALGIGASSVMFSAVDFILLRPLAYRNADSLVVILNHGRGPVAPANYVDWKAQSKSYESMGAAEFWTPDLTGVDKPTRLWGLHITSDILPMVGISPMLGRFFDKEEEQVGREDKVVISYALWQSQFGGDRRALGRRISLDGKSYEIVGVMPAGFKFAPFWATKTELWAPLALGPRATQRSGNSLRIFARLAPGITLADAHVELATVTARLEQQYPGTNRDAQVVPLKDKVVGNVRPALLTMLLAVSFVLLISCANVAHMLLARGAARRGEVAVRSALGAGRRRLIRQFLTESLILGIAGAILGLVFAFGGIRALVLFGPADIPRLDNIALDWHVALFTLGLSLTTTIAFGLAPAWQASRIGPGGSLKEAGRIAGNSPKHRVRSLLVVTEFALALMLLIGAGLMLRTLLALQSIDPGFNPRNVLTMVVSTAAWPASASGRTREFYQEMLDRVRAVPGVAAAGLTNHLPLAGDIWGYPFWIQGRTNPDPGDEPDAAYRLVFPGYFETMGMQILRGRPIDPGDTADASRVVVINEYLAERYWPGEDPIGKHLTLDNPAKATAKMPNWLTVVGVVKNAVRSNWAAPAEEEIFLPYSQNAGVGSYMTLVVRTAADPAAFETMVESAIWGVDHDVTISEVQTMTAVVARGNSQARFNAALLTAFGGVALLLSAVGIYGVMAHEVTRRRHEIGVRMALGASHVNVVGDILRQGVSLALAGSAIGLLAGLLLSRLINTLLYRVQASDPLTLGSSAAVLMVVALAACWVPARHAVRVDPMVALRYE